MQPNRRDFLRQIGWLTAAGAGAVSAPAHASSGHGPPTGDSMGVLVDTTLCVGCRRCEYACKKSNGFEPGPLEAYDDQTVFKRARRPAPDAFTVINAFRPEAKPTETEYVKVNCMHCNHAACVSACIVGALQKNKHGAVTYDAWKCIGCRYCMVACPFQIPTYEYDNVLTPKVMKCQFCVERTGKGQAPACVAVCPRETMTFGKRSELLEIAHKRIKDHPSEYVQHVYGEQEAGGTAWLYLASVPFEQLGFLKVGTAAPPALTEAIQHGVFKYWIAPLGWYGTLGAIMFMTRPKRKAVGATISIPETAPAAEAAEKVEAGTGGTALLEATESEPVGQGAAGTMTAVAPRRLLDAADAPGGNGDGNGKHPAGSQGADATHGRVNHGHAAHGEHHEEAAPVERKLLTPGVWALLALLLAGVGFGLYRFIFGLAAATNLDQQHPWGLWIAMDVGSGIALAGGGFMTAALVHIFHREHYHPIARSALLTALLGYTFYVPGLLADIGRWYNIWHPTLPNMWQGNSVLFEVGICVMVYLNVQYLELMPIVCQRFMNNSRFPRVAGLAKWVHDKLESIMFVFLILGVALSTFHQSSLGNLMVIAPWKLHPLWWTPVSPLLFLLSAMMVGFPMVIFTILFASWSLKRKPEMHILAPLARYIPVFLAVYLAVKVGDMAWRGTYRYLGDGTLDSRAWIAEMLLGVIAPLLMLLLPKVRRSPGWLAAAVLAVILGVVLNRLNVFIIGYHPPYAERNYFPSVTEFALSIGLIAALLFVYRIAVTYLPILPPESKATA